MATTAEASAANAAMYAWKPKTNPWLIAATVALAAFMEVLDTSIANVALPHIAGSARGSQGGCSAGWGSTRATRRLPGSGRRPPGYVICDTLGSVVLITRQRSAARETEKATTSLSSPRQGRLVTSLPGGLSRVMGLVCQRASQDRLGMRRRLQRPPAHHGTVCRRPSCRPF